MKILEIIPTLETGGAEKFCAELSLGLSNDHTVILCILGKINRNAQFYKIIDGKVEIISLNKNRGFSIITLFKLLFLSIKIKPDVIHLHGRSLIYSSLAILFFKSNYFYTVHNTAIGDEPNHFLRWWNGILFNYFKVNPISISKIISKTVASEYSINNNLIIENGVNAMKETPLFNQVNNKIKSIKNNSDTIVFINLARIFPQKNQIMLVQVFNRLIKESENVRLLIVGDDTNDIPTYGDEVKRIAKNGIHFIGKVDNPSDYILASDVLCLSSIHEGLPLSILEGMSLGKYSVSTPAGGVPDVILSEKIGMISESFEDESFYLTLKNAIKYCNDVKIDSRYIVNYFKNNFTMKKTVKSYEKIFND